MIFIYRGNVRKTKCMVESLIIPSRDFQVVIPDFIRKLPPLSLSLSLNKKAKNGQLYCIGKKIPPLYLP